MASSPGKVAGNLVPLLGEGRRPASRPLVAVVAPYVAGAALVCAHVALGACERVSFRLMAVSMSPFYVVLHQLVAGAHLLLFAPIACLQAQLDSSSSQLRRCPKHALLTMAILDTAQCLLALYAGGRVLGATQAVLVQGTIPCTMLLATLVLRTRFERVQVVGAGVVLLGVLGACAAPAGGAAGEEDAVDRALFALSSLFAATGAVYKRRRLMLQVIDCTYLNAWLAFFQFACGLVLAPALFGFDALRGVAYGSREIGPSADDDQVFAHSEVLRNIDEGVRCLLRASDYPSAVCGQASRRVCAWLLSSCLLSLTSRAIMYAHSVPALYVAEVLIIPASALLLSQPALMGALHVGAEAVSARTALLLCATVFGLGVHHSGFVRASCTQLLMPSPDGDSSYASFGTPRAGHGATSGTSSGDDDRSAPTSAALPSGRARRDEELGRPPPQGQAVPLGEGS